MNIYLDEARDLGFDLKQKGTSKYLVLGLLVSETEADNLSIAKAVKKTLRNKIAKNVPEIKGNSTSINIKKYFLKNIGAKSQWGIYAAIADRGIWRKYEKNDLEWYQNFSNRIASEKQYKFLDKKRRPLMREVRGLNVKS